MSLLNCVGLCKNTKNIFYPIFCKVLKDFFYVGVTALDYVKRDYFWLENGISKKK